MMVQEDSLPKANIYSSKILFEQVDIRNKKRMAQQLKRKTALSTKKKQIENSQNNSPKTTINSPKNESGVDDLLFINLRKDKENITNNKLSQNDNQVIIDIKIDSELYKDKYIEKDTEKEIISQNFNNNIKLDNSSGVSNIINENNNYYNNSSTNNSNNNSVLLKDSQEKEVNISNLDNDSIDEILINKDKDEEENAHKIKTNNMFNYDKDDDNNNLINKDESKIKEENEFALKYLTSSSDSFVQLDNNLVARARAQGGDMTDSYLQALFPLLTFDNNKSLKNKNYEVTDIIKEEKEFDTPLRIYNNNSKNSKDMRNDLCNESKGSIDINLNISGINSNSDSFHKYVNNSPNKKIISNYQLYKKKTKIKSKIKNMKDDNSNSDFKYKGNLSFRTIDKTLKKNNTMTKITLNKKNVNNDCLNSSSSSSNITKCKKIINNKFIFNSSFSYHLFPKTKKEPKLGKNQSKVNMKKSLNNLLNKNEKEIDDSLISDYIKNINKPKNIKIKKINSHYIKNINNYQKYKNLNSHINKNIIKKNIAEYNLNKINTENISTINALSSTKRSCFPKDKYSTNYNSIDITKRKSILSTRNFSKKILDNFSSKHNKLNNNINFNTTINKDKDMYHKIKNVSKQKQKLNHHQTSSLIYTTKNAFRKNTKLNNNISKYDLKKSFSKNNFKKMEVNAYLNLEHELKRSKTHKRLVKINAHNESIILNSTFEKNNNKMKNNNSLNKKRKFTNVYKKIDYSYVKAKVETGLSEAMLKKLLNNHQKLTRKQTSKKLETEKKQSLIKRCKITMNKTLENFKAMASSIKKKLFKGGNKDKDKNNINKDEIKSNMIHSSRNYNKK
jgi:hypothetical protein